MPENWIEKKIRIEINKKNEKKTGENKNEEFPLSDYKSLRF